MMSIRTYCVVAVVWLSSLAGVAAVVSAQAHVFMPLPEPKVISGADVGFRVTGMSGAVPVGGIVLRINGQWVEARVGGPPNAVR